MKLWQTILLKLGIRAATVAATGIKSPKTLAIVQDAIETGDLVVDSLAAEAEAKEKK